MASLSSINQEDYELYCSFCNEIGERPVGMNDGFREDLERLMKGHNYERNGNWFRKKKVDS